MAGKHRKGKDDLRSNERNGAPGYLVDPGPLEKVSEKAAEEAREALRRSTPDPITK